MPTLEEDKHKVRITARVPPELRDILEQFLIQSAFEEALRILERETLIRLSQRDAQKVFSLLEHPPKASKQLKDAVKAYRELVRV